MLQVKSEQPFSDINNSVALVALRILYTDTHQKAPIPHNPGSAPVHGVTVSPLKKLKLECASIIYSYRILLT